MHDFEKKLDWARHHLGVVQQSFRDFLRTDKYSVDIEHHRKEREYVARIRAAEPVPDDWSLMVGDIVHNLRSALDALTYVTVERYTPGGFSRAETERLQFLICDYPKEFANRVAHKQRVRWYPPIATAMEGLQPYRRQHGAGSSPLSILRDLSNIDKHRHLVVSGVVLHGVSTFFVLPSGEKLYRRSEYVGPFVDRAVIGQWPELGGGLDPCMNVEPDTVVDIAFGQGTPAPNLSVRRTLGEIIAHITAFVFPALKPFLG